jgi:hypothetical protein
MWAAYHLPLRLRMSGAISLLPLICLHGVDRDNFTPFFFKKKETCGIIWEVFGEPKGLC